MPQCKIAILGAGPAGLMAADQLSRKYEVHIYDKEKLIGQKFVVAGKGGLNITNSSATEVMVSKYSPLGFLDDCLTCYNASVFRDWLRGLGVPTFIGSSGKVFPEKGIMAKDILTLLKNRLLEQGVIFNIHHEFIGFNNEMNPRVKANGQLIPLTADYFIFAFGGASWPQTGSNGIWRSSFESAGIATVPFSPSNCGIETSWPANILEHHTGKPIKNISVSIGNSESRGEALITTKGLEGNAIYPLIPEARRLLSMGQEVFLCLDLKPFNTKEQLLAKALHDNITKRNISQLFTLGPVQLALLKAYTSKEEYLSNDNLVRKIKGLAIPVKALRPIEEAISTTGGIATTELNGDFSLKKHPTLFTIGEMVDWDAPTGGFLLQACFSMGNMVAQSILQSEENKSL